MRREADPVIRIAPAGTIIVPGNVLFHPEMVVREVTNVVSEAMTKRVEDTAASVPSKEWSGTVTVAAVFPRKMTTVRAAAM